MTGFILAAFFIPDSYILTLKCNYSTENTYQKNSKLK
jgi:hypothetical protein